MTATTWTPFKRDDTILGVCQAIGDDFGFNPIWLRIALCVPVVFQSWYGVLAYAALGVAVLVSRLMAPVPAAKPVETTAQTQTAPANEDALLPLAA